MIIQIPAKIKPADGRKIAARKPDGSRLCSPPAPVPVNPVDVHVKEFVAFNAPGGGGPPNRATHRVRLFILKLMNDIGFRVMKQCQQQFWGGTGTGKKTQKMIGF
jgi:hypothetical protein